MRTRWTRSLAPLACAAAFVALGAAESAAQAASWIGVVVAPRDSGARATRGLVVLEVTPDGPADRAGIRRDDVLTSVDGQALRDTGAFQRAVRDRQAGETLRLHVLRDGERRTIAVVVGTQPADTGDDETSNTALRPFRWPAVRPRLGVEVVTLEEHLAPYFESRAGDGLLVTRVEAGSGAAEAGLEPGDVLLEAENRPLPDVEALHAVLDAHRDGDRVALRIRRHGAERALDVEVSGNELAALEPLQRRQLRRGAPDGDDLGTLRRELEALRRDLEAMRRELREDRR